MIAGFRLVLKAVTKDVMEEFRSLKEDIYLNSTASETRIDSKFKEIAGNLTKLNKELGGITNNIAGNLTKLNKELGGITNNIGVLVEINVRSSLLNQNYSESYLHGEKLNSLYDLAKKNCRRMVSTDNSPPPPECVEYQLVEGTSDEVEHATSVLVSEVRSGIDSFAEAIIKEVSQSHDAFLKTQLKSPEVDSAISKLAWDRKS